ncbi:chemotaxis protein CheA, partial [Mycobacterium tuberculosis]
ELDLDAPDNEQLNAIFRAAHSIKGGAATFGFTALTNTTHVLESLLDRARHGQLRLTGRMIDAFLETKDALQE